ncbi:hypothetical protein RvY_12345-2 [Ramazzottius varieornatus]|uniref:ubiquitinyl hydrolase 1 n=1 Tax=Ramazzottius varieornatus TaxID=947166 RepID=A0A1D1VPL0_RAMVA|nr:hypothetical protein RvY_12345-2 [Ramazzottius varieornatus]
MSVFKSLLNINFKLGKDVKQSILSYEDAIKRLPDADVTRLRKSFRKDALGEYLEKPKFIRYIMGENVPSKISEALYLAFGGTSKGIVFKDLVAGLTLLACGTHEEKLDFLYHLCAGGAPTMPLTDLLAMIKIWEDGRIPEHVLRAFGTAELITAEQFRGWISQYSKSMALTRWLLDRPSSERPLPPSSPTSPRSSISSLGPVLVVDPNIVEVPTFYQTLSGVTHLNEGEIHQLQRMYMTLKNNGRFDLSLFASLVCPPIPSAVVINLFQVFDENGDGHVDLKEFICAISACARGPQPDREKFCFKIFDVKRRRALNLEELSNMLKILLSIDENEAKYREADVRKMAQEVMQKYAQDGQREFLTDGDYTLWCQEETRRENTERRPATVTKFMRLLFQMCHIVFGLRPYDPKKPNSHEDELVCVIEWLQRDSQRMKAPGDVYYIVNMDWWRVWRRYMEDGVAPSESTSQDSLPAPDSTPTSSRKRSTGIFSEIVSRLPSTHSRQNSRSSTPLSRSSSTMSIPQAVKEPGPIDNRPLLQSDSLRNQTITAEGGVLKKKSDGSQLKENEHFILVCEAVWRTLKHWYGTAEKSPDLPRQCVMFDNGQVDVDVFPISVRLLKHTQVENTPRTYGSQYAAYGGMVPGAAYSYPSSASTFQTERTFFATACFSAHTSFYDVHETIARYYSSHSRQYSLDDIRLWIYVEENNMTLIDDESYKLKQLNVKDNDKILVEFRNKDLTWPEELSSLSGSHVKKTSLNRSNSISRDDGTYEKGCCGLNNLGNTCFMNSAVQCVSYSRPLTHYFQTQRFISELNRRNPIGYGGAIAERYAELINQLWSGKYRTVAPLKLRQLIGKHRPVFTGYQQHDSQEVLAFLLDGLHEDLNRVHEKPYVELNDSEGRVDEVVAQEAWDNHLRRNQSIVVDLFHGLLRSRVKCLTCSNASVRFDPFSVLSLPLPLDNLLLVEPPLIRCDGQTPRKFGLRVDPDSTYEALVEKYAQIAGLASSDLVPIEITPGRGVIRRYVAQEEKVQRPDANGMLSSDIARIWMYQVPLLSAAELEDRSPSSMEAAARNDRWIMAIHRRMSPKENFYLSWSKSLPVTFGIPVMVACDKSTRCRQLYERVWIQVKRFVRGQDLKDGENANHAQEGAIPQTGYPFKLLLVKEDGLWCSKCPWTQFCRGCELKVSDELFEYASTTICIDWEPSFYHLRYQETKEFSYEEDTSVRRAHTEHTEPISLESCLKAFTHEEELGPDALYQCGKCQKQQLASKRIQLWKLPPALVVHFKRFQKVRDYWVKSPKIVTFPLSNMDLSSYVAAATMISPMTPAEEAALAVPLPLPLSSEQLTNGGTTEYPDMNTSDYGTVDEESESQRTGEGDGRDAKRTSCGGGSGGSQWTSTPSDGDASSASQCDSLPDLSESLDSQKMGRVEGEEYKYDLYAICCHSGSLATGHYVAYCKNPNGKWYLFNDSSCKEVLEKHIDTSTAYMLFYERKGLDYNAFLPDSGTTSSAESAPESATRTPNMEARMNGGMVTNEALAAIDKMDPEERSKYCSIQ